jgi:chaperonin GroES
MNLRPLGDRVLIRPLPQPEQTDSGLWISEDKKPDEMGTVIAVGLQEHPRKAEALELIDLLGCVGDGLKEEETALLLSLVAKSPCVNVGDTVLFSWASGQELTLNDGEDRLLLMRESDLLAVLESE